MIDLRIDRCTHYTNVKSGKDGHRWGSQWHLAQNEFMRADELGWTEEDSLFACSCQWMGGWRDSQIFWTSSATTPSRRMSHSPCPPRRLQAGHKCTRQINMCAAAVEECMGKELQLQ